MAGWVLGKNWAGGVGFSPFLKISIIINLSANHDCSNKLWRLSTHFRLSWFS
jgi:hypothetical protein